MPRNIELIQELFGSKEPLPSIELAYNALKLGGVASNLYALKSDLNGEVDVVLANLNEVLEELKAHKEDDARHLTQTQIDKINDAINATEALRIANSAINSAKESIITSAVQNATTQAENYTDAEVATLKKDLEKQIGNLKVPEITDPITGEKSDQPLSDALENNPQKLINSEHFYRFKNMIENSSFEVFDGNTKIPLGWDNGEVSDGASMFGTYSLRLTSGQTAKQTEKYQTDATWMKSAYNTNDIVLCFYHKFDPVIVKVYDVENEEYMTLTNLKSDLSEGSSATSIQFPYAANWNQYRCMVKFTPKASTKKIRVEFTCATSGEEGECNIDAPSMEPYVEGDFPSIYKDGRYSVSAYQILNPPPADVDRFTSLEHFSVGNCTQDSNGNITKQELLRKNGTLAIKREASNPDSNGFYQTIVETFYKSNGTTVNYVDTYSRTYTSTGAVLTQNKTTTEVV